MIGNLVKIVRMRGQISLGDRSAPNEDALFGILRSLTDMGATVYDEKREAAVFVPMQHIIEIIDQGRRGG